MAVTATASDPIAAPLRSSKRRFRVPGAAIIESSHGLQRALLLFGIFIVAVFILIAIFADLLAPFGFAEISAPQQPMGGEHILGTTVGGFDVLSRIIYGARTAIEVILLAVALSIVVGVPLGVLSGYIGSFLDRVLVLVMDALYAFPSLLLAIVVSIMISGGQSGALTGIMSAAISITVIFVPQYFRVTRNATIQAKVEPYVDAARMAGANPGRIMFRHILPNTSQSIPVLMTLNASEAILTLAGLGFLGFGIEPNSAAEWGYDLNKARSDISNGIWWTAVFPGMAIVLIVLGVTLIGESLNDILNPLLRTRGGTTTADEAEVASVVESSLTDNSASSSSSEPRDSVSPPGSRQASYGMTEEQGSSTSPVIPASEPESSSDSPSLRRANATWQSSDPPSLRGGEAAVAIQNSSQTDISAQDRIAISEVAEQPSDPPPSLRGANATWQSSGSEPGDSVSPPGSRPASYGMTEEQGSEPESPSDPRNDGEYQEGEK